MADDSGSSGLAGVLVGALIVVAVIFAVLYSTGSFGPSVPKSINVEVKPSLTPPAPKSN